MPDDKPLKTYTTAELAKLFNRDVATIRRWIKNGDLPAVKIGGSYFIEEETLRRILRGEKPSEDKK